MALWFYFKFQQRHRI